MIVVLLFGSIILAYQYVTEKGLFDNTIKLYSTINIAGISTKSPVLVNGFRIGEISSIDLIDQKVRVELSIHKDILLNTDAKFVTESNLISDGHSIVVENLRKSNDYYINGDTLRSAIIYRPKEVVLDSAFKYFEPEFKELSKTIGKALIEYVESAEELMQEQN